jgi:hypothetical protein
MSHLQAEPRPAGAAAAAGGASGEAAAQHAAAVAAATAVLNEASASALRDVIANEGISEQQREAQMAEVREKRMQELLYAITVLASNSGEAGVAVWQRARNIGLQGLQRHSRAAGCSGLGFTARSARL